MADRITTREVGLRELKGGGFLALPDSKALRPGVVVIHEAFGLNDNVRDVTQRFAGAGYVALAVDMFNDRNRVVCMARYMGGLITGATNPYGLADLKSALAYLAAPPEVDRDRIGAIGFCMGGGFAIAWACNDSRLKAIAPFYGGTPRDIEAVRRSCPVVGSYPADDFTASMGRSLDAALTRHNVVHDVKIYPGAKHSFFNDRGGRYNKAAAEDSWMRVMKFFGEHLDAG